MKANTIPVMLALLGLMVTAAPLLSRADDMAGMAGMSGDDMSAAAETPADTGMHPVHVGSVTLTNGFVKGMLPGQAVAGGYVTISNGGASDDRLVSLTSSVAASVDIHEMSMENDVMKMRQLTDGLAVPAGKTIEMKPGGFHLMFMGVKTPVRTGALVKVRFKFEKAGEIEAVLPVIDPRSPKAKGQ